MINDQFHYFILLSGWELIKLVIFSSIKRWSCFQNTCKHFLKVARHFQRPPNVFYSVVLVAKETLGFYGLKVEKILSYFNYEIQESSHI